MKYAGYYSKRVIIYLVGLFVMALGVSVSRLSNLGVSPVNSIPAVVSGISGVDMGICTVIVFTGFILVQLILLRKDFKPKYFLQIIGSIVFGLFVSLSNALVVGILPAYTNYAAKMLYVIASIFLVAGGILLYLQADILSLPGEGVMQALSAKTGITIGSAKICFDWTIVIIAVLISLIATGKLSGVREGTLFSALGVGVCLKLLNGLLQEPLRNFLGPKNNM